MKNADSNIEDTLRTVSGLIKDSKERDRRFNQLMQSLNVHVQDAEPLYSKDDLTPEDMKQAEKDLVHWFILADEAERAAQPAPISGKSLNTLGRASEAQTEQGAPAVRPLSMRGLMI